MSVWRGGNGLGVHQEVKVQYTVAYYAAKLMFDSLRCSAIIPTHSTHNNHCPSDTDMDMVHAL